MILKRYNKEYFYDYKTLHLKASLHKKLKAVADKEEISMTKLIEKILKQYESSIG